LPFGLERAGGRLVSLAALAAVFLLTAGRLAGFPVTILIVSGHSMEPALEPLDLVVCVSTRLEGYGVGDIVYWRLSPIVGVIHRVTAVEQGYVVTKGDANPRPDPPVPRSRVAYKVVAVVPREAWLPPGLAGLAVYAWRGRVWRVLREAPGDLEAATLVVASFLTLLLALEFLVSVPLYPRPPEVALPQVQLRAIDHNATSGTIRAYYTVDHTSITGVRGCHLQALGLRDAWGCSAWLVGGYEVIARVPPGFYRELYLASNQSTSFFTLNLTLDLDHGRGVLRGSYPLAYTWRPLRVNATWERVVIVNPNPIPFNATVHVVAYNLSLSGPIIVAEYTRNITVGPGSALTVPLGHPAREARVIVRYPYRFAGGGVVEASFSLRNPVG